MNQKETRNLLIALSVICEGNWDKIYYHITNRIFPDDLDVEKVVSNLSCEVITYFDEEYPSKLKEVRNAPLVLYYIGDISLIKNTENILAVVGTRLPSEYGKESTIKIVSSLKEDVVVVSGMALGIDAVAHRAAIDSGHRTIAVLGSGINVCYPSSNYELYEEIKRNNLIISEYPPNVLPSPAQFPIRNRIVAGLAKCLLVTEAKRRSGTTTTMAFALEANRDVLCVPSSDLDNSACNLCIKDGGFLVENSEDVNLFY